MKQSFTKENIHQLISNLRGFEGLDVSEDGVAYKLVLTEGEKSVCITWPTELGEVFLDYSSNNEVIFQDWFECLESDEVGDFIIYIEQVAKRYLHFETRIERKGMILKSNELQYKTNEQWFNVLHP